MNDALLGYLGLAIVAANYFAMTDAPSIVNSDRSAY